MLPGEKNLTNIVTDTGNSITDIVSPVSFNKAKKLITALYMVTDIIDKEEPIRHKLRTLGTEIISDMHSASLISKSPFNMGTLEVRISEVVSFLHIASAMSFISEMNCSILEHEFMALKSKIEEHTSTKTSWLTGFLASNENESIGPAFAEALAGRHKGHNNEDINRARVGVQKGSTLMKALSDKNLVRNIGRMSNRNRNSTPTNSGFRAEDFDKIKNQRRESIINIIKDSNGNATIKDIRENMNKSMSGVLSFSEKTLQRELMSMMKDGVLNKKGSKRWTRYSIK